MQHSGYLNPALPWDRCLVESLSFIRSSWKSDWHGLPHFLEESIRFLGLDRQASDSVQAALALARSLSHEIEDLYSHAGPGFAEPAYHSRLHFADTLCCITLQLAIEKLAIETEQAGPIDSDWCASACLAALAHDFGHQGKVNTFTSEVEAQTVELLLPKMKAFKLSEAIQGRVTECILMSDFSLAKQNHQKVENAGFSCNQLWLNAILNESDIMASCLPEFGSEMGRLLSEEWKHIDFPPHVSVGTPQGRMQFLSSANFSSHSSRVLGIGEKISTQINELRAAGW